MPNETRGRKHELGDQVRAHERPHPEIDLDPSVAHTNRERSTSAKSNSPHDRGFVVMLWLLALLIAEIEFWLLAFAHMDRM